MKADFTSPTNNVDWYSSWANWVQHNMKITRFFTLAGIAMVMLLTAGCAGPYYGYSDSYSGPYYGSYGPYGGDSVFIWGGNQGGYSGGHHIYGNGYSHSSGYHGSSSSRSSASHANVSHGGGTAHGEGAQGNHH